MHGPLDHRDLIQGLNNDEFEDYLINRGPQVRKISYSGRGRMNRSNRCYPRWPGIFFQYRPADRLFSEASLVIRKHRNRLSDDLARWFICINSWSNEII